MHSRETWLARTLVELADTLVDKYDIVEFLSLLAGRCQELFDSSEVGFLLADQAGNLRVLASSSERLRLLELYELQNEEGPCLASFRTSEPFVNQDLQQGAQRWPRFATEARLRGFTMAHALPMRLRGATIGAVNVLQDHDQRVEEVDLALAQSMADIATIGILQERAVQHVAALAEQLESVLHNRLIIEQAKGVLLERFGVDADTAFSRMRSYGRDHNVLLVDVAQEILAGTVPTDALGPPRQPPG